MIPRFLPTPSSSSNSHRSARFWAFTLFSTLFLYFHRCFHRCFLPTQLLKGDLQFEDRAAGSGEDDRPHPPQPRTHPGTVVDYPEVPERHDVSHEYDCSAAARFLAVRQ